MKSLIQSNGRIVLKFVDDSVCGTGYSFSRHLDGDESTKVTYAPDYMTESISCGDIIETAADYTDNVKDLVVGSTYQYCVASVAHEYMVDTDNDNGSLVRKSDPTCFPHVAAWETSVKVKVASECLFVVFSTGRTNGLTQKSSCVYEWTSSDA